MSLLTPVFKIVENSNRRIATFLTSSFRKSWTPDAVLASYGDTPDRIIIVHVLKTMAEDFSGWTRSGCDPIDLLRHVYDYAAPDNKFVLRNYSKGLEIAGEVKFETKKTGSDYCPRRRITGFKSLRLTVNAVEVSADFLHTVVKTFNTLKKHNDDLEAAAAKAESAMKANEAKWNLAEKLLGMKRNSSGALVPVDKS